MPPDHGRAAFRMRLSGVLSVEQVVAIGALLALFGLGSAMPAWSVASAVTVLLAVLCGLETSSRYRRAALAR
jgi:hypothetical protein